MKQKNHANKTCSQESRAFWKDPHHQEGNNRRMRCPYSLKPISRPLPQLRTWPPKLWWHRPLAFPSSNSPQLLPRGGGGGGGRQLPSLPSSHPGPVPLRQLPPPRPSPGLPGKKPRNRAPHQVCHRGLVQAGGGCPSRWKQELHACKAEMRRTRLAHR